MNINAVPPIIAALIYLLVSLFVYSRKTPSALNRSFALMLLCVCLWNVEWAGLILAPNAEFARLWGNIFRIPLIFIPPTFLHFTFLFTNPKGVSLINRKILLFFYFLSIFLTPISWTSYFHGNVVAYPWGYSFKSGPLFKVFLFEFIAAILICFYYLFKTYVKSGQYNRARLKYFFLAVGISFSLGSINFFPQFGFEIYPLGNIAVMIGLFVAAYSVAQHRLMDVSLFMAKGLSYLISISLISIPAFFIILSLEKYFYKKENTIFSFILILMGIFAVLLFGKIKEKVDRAMHQIIVRDKYYYHRILEDFSKRLVTIMDLNRLLNALAETVEKSMGINNISIYLFNQEKEVYRPTLVRNSLIGDYINKPIKADDPFIKFIQKKNDAILRVELDRDERDPEVTEVQKIMEHIHAEVLLPLIYSQKLIGFVALGYKSREEMYYREDLDLLVTLSNQLAIAIENATLYENMKKSQNILRRSDRLASLGTLIASLAHEIRNPLVSIKTFTQLLPERMDDEEFRDYFLKVATGEIDRLTSLINELLGFAKPTEPNLKGEDINALIDRMGVLIVNEAKKKNITLIKNYDPHLPSVMVDAEQLKQVLLNILLNAIQAIENEGKIWIETRVVQITHEGKTGSYVQIEIRDTGVGISPENIDHVFDPFFSTKPEGSGLGLAISHQIIHEHGGFIDVESEVGKGTSFRINLPLKDGGKSAC